METLFKLLAVILIGIAAFFLWTGRSDAGFASAVLACVSFLISTRFPVKERVEKSNAEILQKRIEEEKDSPDEGPSSVDSKKEELANK